VTPGFAVVVVTHNSAVALEPLSASLAGELGAGDELVVVDNASADATADRARALGLRVIDSGANLGFAAACRLGVEATGAPLVLLLNPDTRVTPGAIDVLRAAAAAQPGWAAWQPVVLLGDGRVNSAGGVVHFLGIGWAGRCGEDAATLRQTPYETAFASGAALVIRREAWREMGGLRDEYFLYGEDLDLGLRLWLAGHRVGVEPRARVHHDYQFDKGAQKWFLLERNRWRTVLATYPPALLVAVAPALLAAELGLLLVAARGGWLREKLRSQWATIAWLPSAPARRRAVQRTRRVGAAQFAAHLGGRLENPFLPVPRALAVSAAAYWRVVRALLR
jgi:N-acetylglucosaminyl-diphospho-decaprenol L-rhamnosyltransferase